MASASLNKVQKAAVESFGKPILIYELEAVKQSSYA